MTRSSDRIRERIRNIALVREPDQRRVRQLWLYMAFLLTLAVPVLFDVAQQSRYVKTRYAMEGLRVERSALEQEFLRLRIERASLESLDLISRRAVRELGLSPSREGLRILPGRKALPARAIARNVSLGDLR